MTFEDLKQHPLYGQLTAKEQEWLAVYLASGSKEKATGAAYDTTTEQSLQNLGNAVFKRENIRALVDFYHTGSTTKLPTKDEFMAIVWEAAKEGRGSGRVAALSLYAELAGLKKAAAPKPDYDELDGLEL